MIDQVTIDRIMDAAQIVDVVSEFVTLRRRGVNYVGLCPFHNEKTPSFSVSPAKGLCKCFSCGKGGNAVHFIMEHEQLSYYEALKWLAKKYGIEVKERELSDEEKQAQSVRESLFLVNDFANKYFQGILHNHPDGQAIGMSYFRQRGFRDDIIRKFQLGFSTEGRDALVVEAKKRGFNTDYLVKLLDQHKAGKKDNSRKIDPEKQTVCLDGEVLGGRRRLVVMLNKPAGFVTATEDKLERSVMELLPPEYQHWDLKPIGRLDKATEGLLLFTNDGELLHRLISPKKQVPKVYYAQHEGQAGEADVAAFAQGLILGDGTQCLSAKLEPMGVGESRITVCEGKYHQVRRMMAARNMHVTYLERISEAGLTLGDLPRGKTRVLTPQELEQLG